MSAVSSDAMQAAAPTPTASEPTISQDLIAPADVEPATATVQSNETDSTTQPLSSQSVTSTAKNEDGQPEVRPRTSPRMIKARADGKLASPKTPRQTAAKLTPSSEQLLQGPASTEKEMPPKKMLKVRADGKLSSPKAKSQQAGDGSKRKRKTVNAAMAERPKFIVKVCYGSISPRQKSLARNISGILSGSNRHGKGEGVTSTIMKPTHPFFLGGTSKIPGDRVPPLHQEENVVNQDRNTNQDKKLSPRKARVNSKPPGIAQGSAVSTSSCLPMFGVDHARLTRFSGALDPIWPPYGLTRIDCSSEIEGRKPTVSLPSNLEKKSKGTQIQTSFDEEVVEPLTRVVARRRFESSRSPETSLRHSKSFQRPLRRIMSGYELQKEVCSRLSSSTQQTFAQESPNALQTYALKMQANASTLHPALANAYTSIPTSFTAFDLFQCETKQWVQKYAPQSTAQVLQPGREVLIMRDWLMQLTVHSTDFKARVAEMPGKFSSSAPYGLKKGRRKKKRQANNMDDFIISSDEEVNTMDEVTDGESTKSSDFTSKRSMVRTLQKSATPGVMGHVSNAIVLSGPHGCGKTSAVYAAARELGFEVFEITAGSRRSGKDLIDRVGDMTRNHLVKHRDEGRNLDTPEHEADLNRLDEHLQADLESGRQGVLKGFFQTKSAAKSNAVDEKLTKKRSPKKKTSRPSGKEVKPGVNGPPKPSNQKQSLILLEEVDILFEEDKLFWATVIDLIQTSKRPVIMTCCDESLLPLEELDLHGILRFTTPPETLAVDYLLLIAGNEGHLLSRESVCALFVEKRADLRASLMELNLYCQMGVGDRKGGLEWMYIDNVIKSTQENNQTMRVVSENTYVTSMAQLGGQTTSNIANQTLNANVKTHSHVWRDWHLDLSENPHTTEVHHGSKEESSRSQNLSALNMMDLALDALSVSDAHPASATRGDSAEALDTMQPDLTEKLRPHYPELPQLLQADLFIDPSGLSESLPFTLKAFAAPQAGLPASSLKNQKTIEERLSRSSSHRSPQTYSLAKAECKAAAFENLARYSTPTLGIPKGPLISVFDGPTGPLAEDVAPYVRAIVSYDLRLEEQRRQLSSLMTNTGAGSKASTRKTRASLAALEGGDKANTRRDRWFHKDTDFDAILRTGGEGWQETLLHGMEETNTPGSQNSATSESASTRDDTQDEEM